VKYRGHGGQKAKKKKAYLSAASRRDKRAKAREWWAENSYPKNDTMVRGEKKGGTRKNNWGLKSRAIRMKKEA